MKIRILMLATFLCMRTALAAESGQITTAVQVDPYYTQLGTDYWYSSSTSYVNGGVTFTFPTDLFLQTPTVIVSLSIDSYDSTSIYSAIVTAVDSTSVTVNVTVGTLLSIGEAATDSVTVNVWVLGTEN